VSSEHLRIYATRYSKDGIEDDEVEEGKVPGNPHPSRRPIAFVAFNPVCEMLARFHVDVQSKVKTK
jgi:hypothetical protein